MILREGRSGALNYSAKEPNNWVEQEAGDCEFEDVRLGRRLVSLLGPQFLYLEDNPRNWRSAFAILPYRNGKLMLPELVLGWDEKRVQFSRRIGEAMTRGKKKPLMTILWADLGTTSTVG